MLFYYVFWLFINNNIWCIKWIIKWVSWYTFQKKLKIQNHIMTILLNIQKDNEIVDKYGQKRNRNLNSLLIKMVKLVNDIKPIVNICEKSIFIIVATSLKTYSKLTTKNCGELLHYIFVVTLKTLLILI